MTEAKKHKTEQDLCERMNLLYKAMKATIKEINRKKLLNEQYVIEWIDNMNKLTVSV